MSSVVYAFGIMSCIIAGLIILTSVILFIKSIFFDKRDVLIDDIRKQIKELIENESAEQ